MEGIFKGVIDLGLEGFRTIQTTEQHKATVAGNVAASNLQAQTNIALANIANNKFLYMSVALVAVVAVVYAMTK